MQVFKPTTEHVFNSSFPFAPANPNMYGINPESDKFRKLMLKRQKKESKKQKNVLSEFQSGDQSGDGAYDLDSVLKGFEEAGESEKKAKKNKARKRRDSGKRQQREEDGDRNQEDPEETTEPEKMKGAQAWRDGHWTECGLVTNYSWKHNIL